MTGGPVIAAPHRVEDFAAATGAMPELLRALVEAESPSDDVALTAACAELVADRGARAFGVAPELVATGSRIQVRWRFGRPRVLVLGHLDTVWPRGTIHRWPFRIADGRASGPGVFDMKVGLERVDRTIHALRATLPGALEGGVDSPPLPRAASADLFTLAARTADALGIGPLRERPAGGTSDGNHTAGIGVRTLDGLGGVGGNAHTEGEWAQIAAMPGRTALLFHLLSALRSGGPSRPPQGPGSVTIRP